MSGRSQIRLNKTPPSQNQEGGARTTERFEGGSLSLIIIELSLLSFEFQKSVLGER